ncbi:MAG TPA: hypothetical protein VG389_05255, partial [Myxococcota bacterium]|nr:hypothetical protein [Myxococcota bacterium]
APARATAVAPAPVGPAAATAGRAHKALAARAHKALAARAHKAVRAPAPAPAPATAAAAAAAAPPVTAAPGAEMARLAVYVAAAPGTRPDLASSVTELVIAEVGGRGIESVGSAEFRSALGGSDERALACGLDPVCMREAGRLLGVKRVLFGSVALDIDRGEFSLGLNVIDVESGRVLGHADARVSSEEKLLERVPSLTRAVLEDAARPPGGPAAAVVPTRRSYLLPAVAGGAAVGALGAAVVLGLLSQRAVPLDEGQAAAFAAADARRREAISANVLFVTAGVAAATAVLLFVVVATTGGRRSAAGAAAAALAPAAGGGLGLTLVRF